jgi:hydroxymethylbilane synthase
MLALRQTQQVVDALRQRFPGQELVVRTVQTLGDRVQDVPLSRFGTTGVFSKEIERLLLDGTIDLAVHSLKDVPPDETPGTVLAAFVERIDPRDVLVSRDGRRLGQLTPGDRVGTSSVRRLAQLRAARPDLAYVEDLRGNVDTRLRKVFAGAYDAIVLAAAGLIRLGREDAIADYLPTDLCLPDAGQGILAVQTRSPDPAVAPFVAALDDPVVRAVALAERAVLDAFGGGCKVPVAAYARVEDGVIRLEALVAEPDGSRVIRERLDGPLDRPRELGRATWDRLVARGAGEIVGVRTDG